MALLFYGYDKSNVLDASIIGNTAPIFVVLGGAILLRENVTKKEIVGIITTLLGTLIVVAEPLFNDIQIGERSTMGNLLIILANIAWVIYVIITKKELHHKIDVLLMTTYMFVLGFLSCLPFALYQSGGATNLLYTVSLAPFKAHLGVWYMAVLSGSLAYFLFQKGQKNIEASEATLFSYLSPIFAAPLAVFWLKEEVTLPFIIGTTIIILGVFVAEYRKTKGTK
jgi:drug/metabolite transporter (DMT)-like permease